MMKPKRKKNNNISLSVISFTNSEYASVTSMIEMSDGSIVTASQDNVVRRWRLEIRASSLVMLVNDGLRDENSAICIQEFVGHHKSVYCLAELDEFSFVSGSFDKTLKRWDTRTGDCVATFVGHHMGVYCVVKLNYFEKQQHQHQHGGDSNFNNNQTTKTNCKYFASGSSDGNIRLWKSDAEGEVLDCFRTIRVKSRTIVSLAELNDGILACSSSSHLIHLYDLKSKNCSELSTTTLGHIRSLIQLRGSVIVCCSSDGRIHVWKTLVSNSGDGSSSSGSRVSFDGHHPHTILLMSKLNEVSFATAGSDELVCGWNEKGMMLFHCYSAARCLVALSDRSLLLCGLLNGLIEVWNTEKR